MFPEIKPGLRLDRLPPQMKAEAALLLAEAGFDSDAVSDRVHINSLQARRMLIACGPFRRGDDFNSSAPNGGVE